MKRSPAAVLFICFLLCGAAASAQEAVTSCKGDFDGDGKQEEAVLSRIAEDGSFTLSVGNVSAKGKLENGEADLVKKVDIDSSDKTREIAVHTSGPSDDNEWLFYRFDGKSLAELGRIFGSCDIAGNGIILADQWMGFWIKKEKFVLDDTAKKLKAVPQQFYFVGVEAKVKKSFPIFRTRTSKEVVANLMEGSTVLFVASDLSSGDYGDEWYLIRSKTGLLGWANIARIQEKVEGLPWAD